MKNKIETLKKIRHPKLSEGETDWLKQHNAFYRNGRYNVVVCTPSDHDKKIVEQIGRKTDIKVVYLVEAKN